MSQNVTLSNADLIDIEKIKPMLLENKTQVEISVALGKRRETVNRKISRWLRTADFEVWVKQAWLDKLRKVGDVEAFRGLTKLMTAYAKQQADSQIGPIGNIAFRWLSDEEWKEKLSSNTVHIQGKEYFMKATRDSESSVAEDDGAKPEAEQTSS